MSGLTRNMGWANFNTNFICSRKNQNCPLSICTYIYYKKHNYFDIYSYLTKKV